jgi:hypothetical protein
MTLKHPDWAGVEGRAPCGAGISAEVGRVVQRAVPFNQVGTGDKDMPECKHMPGDDCVVGDRTDP